MKRILVLLLIVATASLANALPVFSASWEDGEVNPGGNDQVTTLNTTPYPATQPETVTDSEYGWAVKNFNYTASLTIVDTAAKSGSNSVLAKNTNFRTDIKHTILANTVYTYTIWYMLDAANDPEGDKMFTIRMALKDQTHNTFLADTGSAAMISITVPAYNTWYSKSITWDSTGYAYATQEVQWRTMCQISGTSTGGNFTNSGGAYLDSMLVTPEPATMVLLGLGSLALLRRKR